VSRCREWTTYQGCWTIYNGAGTGADDVFRQYNAIRCFRLAGRALLPMTVRRLHSDFGTANRVLQHLLHSTCSFTTCRWLEIMYAAHTAS
jgi:hypothetical protein